MIILTILLLTLILIIIIIIIIIIIPTLEDGQQYKFLGVLESRRQEERIVLRCPACEYLHRLSVIWSSPLSDYHRVIASNQFALPGMPYFMWTQHWPITELRQVNRDARKIATEGGGKHPCGTTSLLYLSRNRGRRGQPCVPQSSCIRTEIRP